MSIVLMTGFEPFGGEAVNASWEAVRKLEGARVGDSEIRVLLLPTTFGEADELLVAAMRELEPSAVIMVGQAAGRDAIAIEQRAINRAHASIPDNAGRQPSDRKLVAHGPAAYATSLPISAIARGLRGAGIAVRSSVSAGTFVCNSVFFAACHHRAVEQPGLPVGFIHVPVTPAQAAKRPLLASMATENVVSGLRVAAMMTLAALSAPKRGQRQASALLA